MRNLKKVLSLTLALVMMLGMMTFAGAAETTKKTSADLTDMDKVVNKEAVSLLVDLGIVGGRDTGAFDPTGTLKRGEFAKMICITKLGSDKGANLAGGTSPLTDIKGHWAEGYIKYCYSTKIVAGTTPTTFTPDGELKVVEAAKMLLTALGYDADLSKYNADPFWNSNIMTDAQVAGLMDGVSQISDEKITRDNAAQMILNALFANQVKPEIDRDMGKIYLTGYVNKYSSKNQLGQFVFDLMKVTAPVTSINTKGKADLGTPVSGALSVSNPSMVDEILPGTPEMVGSTVAIYVKGSVAGSTLTIKEVYSAKPAVSASNVLATNYGYKVGSASATTATTGTTALTALLVTEKTKVASLEAGSANVDVIGDLSIYYNGALDDAKKTEIGKFGVVTEFKDTDDVAGVDTVVITKKTVATLSAAPVVSGGKVTIPSLAISSTDTAKVIGYEGLAKDDVVLYVKMGGMTYIEKAATAEGVIAGTHSSKGTLIDGTYYLSSMLTSVTVPDDFKNTYKVYLDNGKNIVKFEKITDKATASNFGILSNIALVKTDGVDGTHYVEGKIVHTDGTVEKMKIASINGVKVVLHGATAEAGLYMYKATNDKDAAGATYAAGKFYYTKGADEAHYAAKYFCADTTAALTAPSVGMDADKTANVVPFADLGSFYEYTVNTDGTYALKNTASDNVKYASLANAVMNNGKAVFNTGNIGNSATVFIYETADSNGDPVYTVYKGIANAPATADKVSNHEDAGTADANLKTIVTNGAGVATFVYAKVTGTTTEAKDYIYFNDVANYGTVKDGSTTYYTFEAILNGKNTTVKISDDPAASTNLDTVGLYLCKNVNDKGVYTLNAPTTPVSATATGIKSVVGGSIILGDATAYTYNSDTLAFHIDGDDVSTPVAPDSIILNAYDKVYVIDTNSDRNAEVIYVVHAAPFMTTWTLTAGTTKGVSTIAADFMNVTPDTVAASNSNNTVQFEAANVATATNTTLVRITINDTVVAVDTDFEILKGVDTLNIKVVVKDNCSGAEDVISATVAVTNSRT